MSESEQSSGRERGASSAEYVGAITVAAIVVGTVIFTVSPQGTHVRAAVCDSVGSVLQTDASCGSADEGSGGAAGDTPSGGDDGPTDEDFRPPVCQVSQSDERHNAVLHIGPVDVGQDSGFLKTVMSDGTVTLTAADGQMFGGSGGVGAELRSGGGMHLGGTVDFGGGITVDSGDTWTFKGDDAEAQAEEFIETIKEERRMDTLYYHGGRGPTAMREISTIDSVRPPDSTTSEVGVTGDVGTQLGLDFTGTQDGSGPSMEMEAVAASVAADATWAQTIDTHGTEGAEDDTTTYTVDMSINPDAASDIWSADLGLGETKGMSMAVTQNAEGQITEVAIVSTNEGAINGGANLEGAASDGPGDDASSGSATVFTSDTETTATVTTTTLTLDPRAPGYAEDAAVVEAWLGGDGYSWPGTVPMSAVNPAHGGSDPFSQLMHEQANVSAVTSEGVTSTSGLAAEVAVGMKFGFDMSSSSGESSAVYAAFLGAPEDGTRTMVPYDDCS